MSFNLNNNFFNSTLTERLLILSSKLDVQSEQTNINS